MGSLSISLSGWGDIYSRGVLAGLLVGILSWFWELWFISHNKEGVSDFGKASTLNRLG